MASFLFTTYLDSRLDEVPSVDLDASTIKARLVNVATDNANLTGAGPAAAIDFIDDVTEYLATTDPTLANKTTTAGVFDNTADLTNSSVAIDGAKDADGVVIYKDTGSEATSPVICFCEFATAVTPNGGDIETAFSGSGIFSL